MFSINKTSMNLFPDTETYSKKLKNKEKNNYEKLNLSDIIQVDFPSDQYYRKQTSKNQIVLHHTVSGLGVNGDISWWRQTTSRIATAIIIDRNGDIYQCFSTKYWGHHLGVKTSNNVTLNKGSIGVEIDSWGGLVQHDNKKWYPARWDKYKKKYLPNLRFNPIDNVQVYKDKFRGFRGFEKYTDKQIESIRKLLIYWSERYNIPLNYNHDMWKLNKLALNGVDGIWTHVSYRKDKSDCHPQPELIEMLKSLNKK